MSSETERYHVKLIAGFKMPSRVRAGVTIERGPGAIVELTKEQVEAINEDPYFEIRKVKKGESLEQSTKAKAKATDEASDNPEDEADEDSDAGDAETGSGEDEAADEAPDADTLVRDHSREELNELAVEAGVDSPDALENKQAVAEAIVEARG